MHLRASKPLFAVIVAVLSVGAVALVRDTFYQGQDFEVFWSAARALLSGSPVYDLSRTDGMVFKYPPWILPFFVPFGLLPLGAAKIGWGLVEILGLVAILGWTRRAAGCSWAPILGTAIVFWGIWAVHCLDGQVAIPILAVALWGRFASRDSAAAGAILALSAKVFTLVALAGSPRWLFRRRVVSIAVAAIVVLSAPVFLVSPDRTVGGLTSDWLEAASSGGTRLAGEKIRGRDNQGLPAAALRLMGVPAENGRADVAAFLLLSVLVGWYWTRRSSRLPPLERWAGWLALAAVVHPLAWFHQFVFAYPAAVLALDRSSRDRMKRSVPWLAVAGVVLIAAVTRKTLGPVGAWLELCSVKSWGVLLCLEALARAGGWRQPKDASRA